MKQLIDGLWTVIYLPAYNVSHYMQMSLEFGLVMERPNIREEFDDELYFWSKAIISYCNVSQKNVLQYKLC